MSKKRQFSGDETIDTLLRWVKDSKTAERLASAILHIENYKNIDPSHPLGGRDGTKDIICTKEAKNFIVAVYFPRSPQTFTTITKKIANDIKGVQKNKADGIIIFTNQHLTNTQKDNIKNTFKSTIVEIYHLERIASILNSPSGYGIRLEFLGVEVDKTEQLSYFAYKDKEISAIKNNLASLLDTLKKAGSIPNVSTDKLEEFKSTLGTIVGSNSSLYMYGNSMIDKLRVPLGDLKEFATLLYKMAGNEYGLTYSFTPSPLHRLNVPLRDLEDFRDILYEIVGDDNVGVANLSPIHRLSIPLNDLEQYNETLDEVLEKLREIESLKQKTKS